MGNRVCLPVVDPERASLQEEALEILPLYWLKNLSETQRLCYRSYPNETGAILAEDLCDSVGNYLQGIAAPAAILERVLILARGFLPEGVTEERARAFLEEQRVKLFQKGEGFNGKLAGTD